MIHAGLDRFVRTRGFSLIESIIVVVVLSVAAAAIIGLQSGIFYGQTDSDKIQVGAYLMQECAEHILATRRKATSGYSSIGTASCPKPPMGNYGGITGAPVVTVAPDGVNGTSCVSTSNTCLVSISIAGLGLTPIYVNLVNY